MNTNIVIMAAGKGTRMNSETPKVLHQLAGKPMLQHVMQTADQIFPSDIIVVAGYKHDEVISFADRLNTRSRKLFAIQEPQLGTGHAVQIASNFLNGAGDPSTTIVLNGDVPLIPANTLKKLESMCAGCDLVLLTIDMADPTGYGRIVRNEAGWIIGIVEHKDCTPEQLAITEVYTGILAAPTRMLAVWVQNLDNDNAQKEFYLTDIVKMAASATVFGAPNVVSIKAEKPHHVMGVNSPEQLAELEAMMPVPYEAVNFGGDEWRAVVGGKLQKPDFNSKGAALAFAKGVHEGNRKPEYA